MKLWLVAAASLLLASCVSAPQWRHAHLSGAQAEYAFAVADGECVRRSTAAVPTPYAPPAPRNPGPLANAQYVQQQGEVGAARGHRQRVYAGCMAEHGWMQATR